MLKNVLSQIEKMASRIQTRVIQISDDDLSVKEPFPWNGVRYFLRVLSALYGAAISIRIWLYSKNIIESRKVPCFVISIGNIVAGGSGKTPMTIYMAEMARSMGLKPLVVSRGYGGAVEREGECSFLAGDGEGGLISDPQIVGDEPFMMASRLSFPVVVGKDRFKAIMMSLDLFRAEGEGIDLIILDDGFQHIRLKRDLNIVLMDCNRPFGNGSLLPAGRLRESPLRALERADITVFTRYSGDGSYKQIINDHKKSGNIFFTASHRPFLHRFLKRAQISPVVTLEELKGRQACLFSGIADNSSFRKTVEKLGLSVKAHLEFNDHHMYKGEEISMIVETYQRVGADLMMTTEKDYARLSADMQRDLLMDFAVVGIEIDFMDKKEEFENLIRERFLKDLFLRKRLETIANSTV